MTQKSILFALLLVLFCSCVNAQDKTPVIVDEITGASCERVAAAFDVFVQGATPRRSVIVIAYRGRSDTMDSVRQRLRIATAFLRERFANAPFTASRDSILAATSDEVLHYGRLDIYVDGELALRATFRRKVYLGLSPCYG